MAKAEAKTEEKGVDTTAVVRDSTFARATADRGIVIDLGRDMEICFLQISPTILAIDDFGESEALRMNPALTEVTRVRISRRGAVDLAMHVFREAVTAGGMPREKIIGNIEEFLNLPPESELEEKVSK